MRKLIDRYRRHAARGSRAQALTEFALVLPVMLLLLLIAADFGRLFFTYVAVHNAAREAANYAAVHAADNPFDLAAFNTGAQTAGSGEANAQGQGGEGTMTVSDPVCFPAGSPSTPIACAAAANFATGIGNHVSVNVTQDFTFLTPIIGIVVGDTLTLQASATAPVFNPEVAAIFASPTPTAAPTPTPTPSPTATATATSPGATPTPSPTASPVPHCIVPDYKNTFWNDIGSQQVWHDAGFTGTLTNLAGPNKIKSQEWKKDPSQLCTISMWVDDN